jgi:type II restriction/modification system DNA methylase subunit YeeA
MKTIEPLFLDEIREEFDKYYDDSKKLQKLWDRISQIKIFDPACGSGNFLIIAYKELRKIEHGIIDRLFSDDYRRAMVSGKLKSRIKLDNFYGIEIDDFAHEIAILSLYLAKHQMNIEFEQHFGKEIILIPLKDNANIVHGNSALLDWQEVCPNRPQRLSVSNVKQATLIELEQVQEELELSKEEWEEIYLIGNPPYLGSSLQDKQQKSEMKDVFISFKNYKNLDYIALWFKKGCDYIYDTEAKLAFVSTNSIVQGEAIPLLWPYILEKVEISYAYTSFKWSNSARGKAGVSCVVIGLSSVSVKSKYIFTDNIAAPVTHINAYLAPGSNVIVRTENAPISELPEMLLGNMSIEGGFLKLSPDEKAEIESYDHESSKFIRNMVGGGNLLDGKPRYCIWIENQDVEEASRNPIIKRRI